MIGTFLAYCALPQLWSLFSEAETCEAYSGYSSAPLICATRLLPGFLSLLRFFSSSFISLALFSIVNSRLFDLATILNFLIS